MDKDSRIKCGNDNTLAKSLLSGTQLPRMRKLYIISLQVQPTLVDCANHAEASGVVEAAATAPGRNRTAGSDRAPAAATEDVAGAGRRTRRRSACAYSAVPVPAQFPYVAAHVVKVKAVL